MSLSTQTAPTDPKPDVSDITHIVCCRDENRLLCGFDGTLIPWGRQPGEVECVVCADLEGPKCPLSGRPCPP